MYKIYVIVIIIIIAIIISSIRNVGKENFANFSIRNTDASGVVGNASSFFGQSSLDKTYADLKSEVYTNLPREIDTKVNTKADRLKKDIEGIINVRLSDAAVRELNPADAANILRGEDKTKIDGLLQDYPVGGTLKFKDILTPENKTKIDGLLTGYSGNLRFSDILTSEQKNRLTTMLSGYEASGFSFSELGNKILTPDQKNKLTTMLSGYEASGLDFSQLGNKFLTQAEKDSLANVLTSEQKNKLTTMLSGYEASGLDFSQLGNKFLTQDEKDRLANVLPSGDKAKLTSMLEGYTSGLKFSELQNSILTPAEKTSLGNVLTREDKITGFFGTAPLTKTYSEMYNLLYDNDTGFSSVRTKVNDLMSRSSTSSTVVSTLNNTTDIIQISAGYNYSLFLLYDGSVLGCGNNGNGQLGIGNKSEQLVPVYVKISDTQNLSNVKQICAAATHAVYLLKGDNEGKVMTCGNNANGQLGDGTDVEKTTPVLLNISNVKQISAKATHTMFLLNDGTVKGCGNNDNGQLGNGKRASIVNTPVVVNALQGVVQVSCGMGYTLFLLNDNTVLGCGYNGNGQLGDGTTIDRLTPVNVKNTDGIEKLKNIKEICAGYYVSLFILTDGTLMGCGNNFYSQIGNNTLQFNRPEFRRNIDDTAYLNNVKTVSSGISHTLILLNSGEVLASGLNQNGELGDNTKDKRMTLVYVKKSSTVNISNVKNISAGMTHSLFLINDNNVLSCGLNTNGQLGDNTRNQRSIPNNVKRDATTTLYLGMPLPTKTEALSPLSSIIKYVNDSEPVISTSTHSLLLLGNGEVLTWGLNTNGQLGISSSIAAPNNNSRFPIYVKNSGGNENLSGVKDVKAAKNYSLFLMHDGTVLACGRNNNGHLGRGNNTDLYLPTNVLTRIDAFANPGTNNALASAKNLEGVIKIAAGENHTLFLLENNKVYKVMSCGYNVEGQLGTNNVTAYNLPQMVKFLPLPLSPANTTTNVLTDLTGVKDVVAGYAHSFFIMNDPDDKKVMSCGKNNVRQLGHGDTTNRSIPRYVLRTITSGIDVPLTGITKVSAGEAHSLFLMDDKRVMSVGANANGELGNSSTVNSPSYPTYVKIGGGSASFFINAIDISAGKNNSIFIKDEGTSIKNAYGCGNNTNAKLGLGGTAGICDTTNRNIPTLIDSIFSLDGTTEILDKVINISAGEENTSFMVIDITGSIKIKVAGGNGNGELGNNNLPATTCVPVNIRTITGAGEYVLKQSW